MQQYEQDANVAQFTKEDCKFAHRPAQDNVLTLFFKVSSTPISCKKEWSYEPLNGRLTFVTTDTVKVERTVVVQSVAEKVFNRPQKNQFRNVDRRVRFEQQKSKTKIKKTKAPSNKKGAFRLCIAWFKQPNCQKCYYHF